jgi:hypothetical protein
MLVIRAFIVLGLLTILSACSGALTFHGKGLIPMYVGAKKDHDTPIEIEGEKEVYLWGNINPDNEVFIDEELYNQGMLSAANITVHQYQSKMNFIISLLSFGLYMPKNYRIRAFGKQLGDDE